MRFEMRLALANKCSLCRQNVDSDLVLPDNVVPRSLPSGRVSCFGIALLDYCYVCKMPLGHVSRERILKKAWRADMVAAKEALAEAPGASP